MVELVNKSYLTCIRYRYRYRTYNNFAKTGSDPDPMTNFQIRQIRMNSDRIRIRNPTKNTGGCVAITELGASLFEIAQLLYALEQTCILGAMALSKKKNEERQAN